MNQKEIAAKYGKEIAKRITSRKIGGDDYASHAVLIDGRVFVNGLTQGEVGYYKFIAAKKLAAQDKANEITIDSRRMLIL